MTINVEAPTGQAWPLRRHHRIGPSRIGLKGKRLWLTLSVPLTQIRLMEKIR